MADDSDDCNDDTDDRCISSVLLTAITHGFLSTYSTYVKTLEYFILCGKRAAHILCAEGRHSESSSSAAMPAPPQQQNLLPTRPSVADGF